MDINGSIVLITGGNKGIGLATARQLGQRGASIIIGARNADRGAAAVQSLQEEGITAAAVTLDVTDDTSIEAAAKDVDDRFGRVDVLINNAGIVGSEHANVLPSVTTREGLREIFEVNVFGLVATTNAFLPLLRRSEHPRIVNVSSEVASMTSMFDPAHPFFGINETAYPASKSAVNMITAMYAKELGGDGFIVNAAIPGWTATDFNNFQGPRTAEQAASVVVELATVDDGGRNGAFWGAMAAKDDELGFPGW